MSETTYPDEDEAVAHDGVDDEVVDGPPPLGELEQVFKCGSCAGKMSFEPGSDAQKCPYCGFENPIPKSEEDIVELDFKTFLAECPDSKDIVEQLTVDCSECGAQVTTEPNVSAQQCAFCGSDIIATAHSSKHIKPKSLLPFKVTRKEGQTSFGDWMGGLWFAPNSLKEMARQDGKLSGMYVPYWTYDSDTKSYYTGQRGEYYYVTISYTTRENGKTVHRTRQERRTRWYSASGTVWESFDDVLILASKSLPRKYTEKLEPWDLDNLVPYKDEYLTGFKAESYQIDLADGFGYSAKIMDVHIRHLVERDIGGDVQRIHSVKTQHDNVTFKHVLLPIWISAYRYKEKVYRFLVNARTGEVQGERPWSVMKIALAVAGGLAAIGTIVAIIMSSQQ
jgi:DNA-directed RNA polymerase subunit RPC12/RpoP